MGDEKDKPRLVDSEDGGEDGYLGDPLAGTPYRATKRIGRGGTAIVYEARPRTGGHRVAVKVMRPQFLTSPQAIERMRIETEILLSVRHPNIVRVYDFGRLPHEGGPYLVEQRLYGHTLLREVQKRGPIPAPEAITWVRQILSGLELLHETGILHRDLKPDNVFLSRNRGGESTLKLLDFGFAKIMRIETETWRPTPPVLSTDESQFVGTPRFAAPEQMVFGFEPSHHADLYTVGLVLYTLLAGRLPFAELEHSSAIVAAQIDQCLESPSKYAHQPIAVELEQFLNKALEKHPNDRFQSARQMNDELESIGQRLRPSDESAVTPSHALARGARPIGGARLTALFVCTVAAVATAVFLVLRRIGGLW